MRDCDPIGDLTEIVAVRNRIAHGYGTVQRRVVWSIIRKELPVLRLAVERMIALRSDGA